MSEETAVEAPAAEPAATPETVATPPAETQAPEDVKTEAEAKVFTQEEVNAIVQKEKARAARIAESRAMKQRVEALERTIPQLVQPQEKAVPQLPTRDQFNSDSEYVAGIIKFDREQQEQARQAEQQQHRARELQSRTESVYAEAMKLPGFDRDSFDSLPLTTAIAAAVVDSDIPAQLMHYMASNPDEVAEISKLSPARQAAAIGRMEAKVAQSPAISKAPPPLKAVGTRGSSGSNDLSKSSMEDYISARKKQGARWAR